MSSYYNLCHSFSLSETLSIIFWSKTCNQQIMVTPLKWLRATILIIYMQFPIKLVLIKFFMIHIFKYLSLTKTILYFVGWGMVVDFCVTFNNISAISWRSVLFVEENGENNGHVVIYWQTYHMLYRVHLAMGGILTYNFSDAWNRLQR